jgi:hypothetical protein
MTRRGTKVDDTNHTNACVPIGFSQLRLPCWIWTHLWQIILVHIRGKLAIRKLQAVGSAQQHSCLRAC